MKFCEYQLVDSLLPEHRGLRADEGDAASTAHPRGRLPNHDHQTGGDRWNSFFR